MSQSPFEIIYHYIVPPVIYPEGKRIADALSGPGTGERLMEQLKQVYDGNYEN